MGLLLFLFYFQFYFSAANPSRCFSLGLFASFLFLFDSVPLSLLLHFYFAVWRTRCPRLSMFRVLGYLDTVIC